VPSIAWHAVDNRRKLNNQETMLDRLLDPTHEKELKIHKNQIKSKKKNLTTHQASAWRVVNKKRKIKDQEMVLGPPPGRIWAQHIKKNK
jgi:hypothetical protein